MINKISYNDCKDKDDNLVPPEIIDSYRGGVLDLEKNTGKISSYVLGLFLYWLFFDKSIEDNSSDLYKKIKTHNKDNYEVVERVLKKPFKDQVMVVKHKSL